MNTETPKGTYTNAKGEVRDLRELGNLSPVDMINIATGNATLEQVLDKNSAEGQNND